VEFEVIRSRTSSFRNSGAPSSDPPRSASSDQAAVLRLRRANNQAIAARDLPGTLAIAADDYVLVAGADTIVRTREEIARVWAAAFADGDTGGCE
jgi:ketosteroid isomerase-like protein